MRKIMAKYKVKNTTILHDGVSRGEGSIIELTDLQAKKLEGFVELVKEKAPANLIIQVDGGINEQTAKICTSKGANSLVAGNYIYKSK